MSAALLAQGAVFPVAFSHHSSPAFSPSAHQMPLGVREFAIQEGATREQWSTGFARGFFFLFKLPVVFTSVCVLDSRGKNRLYIND